MQMQLNYENVDMLANKYGKSVVKGIFNFCTSDAIDSYIRLGESNEYLYITTSLTGEISMEVRPCGD